MKSGGTRIDQAGPDAGPILPDADRQVNTGLGTGTADTPGLQMPIVRIVSFPSRIGSIQWDS